MRSPCSSDASDCMSKLALASRPRHDLDGDFRGIRQHDRSVGQGVRRNRHQHPARNGGVQQGPACRQGIRRRAGGRGDDQTVGPLIGHEVPVDFDPQFHHARGGAAVDHHVVHRERIKYAVAVAHDPGVHQAAVVFLVLAAQHGRERGLVVLEWNVGDEAQASLVDADERHAVVRQLAADAQHGAVAADHQPQVALGADGSARPASVYRVMPALAAVSCSISTSQPWELRNWAISSSTCASRVGLRTRHRGVVFADQGNLAEYGFHLQITSLKSIHAR